MEHESQTDQEQRDALALMQSIANDAGLEHISTLIQAELARLAAISGEDKAA